MRVRKGSLAIFVVALVLGVALALSSLTVFNGRDIVGIAVIVVGTVFAIRGFEDTYEKEK